MAPITGALSMLTKDTEDNVAQFDAQNIQPDPASQPVNMLGPQAADAARWDLASSTDVQGQLSDAMAAGSNIVGKVPGVVKEAPAPGEVPVQPGILGPARGETAVTGPTESATVRGQITSLLDDESKYIQDARGRAVAAASGRGMLNSLMAAQAGETAAIREAKDIAGKDADITAGFQEREQTGDIRSRQIGEEGDILTGQIEQRGDIESRQIGERGDVESGLLGEKAGYEKDSATAEWNRTKEGWDIQQTNKFAEMDKAYGIEEKRTATLQAFEEKMFDKGWDNDKITLMSGLVNDSMSKLLQSSAAMMSSENVTPEEMDSFMDNLNTIGPTLSALFGFDDMDWGGMD